MNRRIEDLIGKYRLRREDLRRSAEDSLREYLALEKQKAERLTANGDQGSAVHHAGLAGVAQIALDLLEAAGTKEPNEPGRATVNVGSHPGPGPRPQWTVSVTTRIGSMTVHAQDDTGDEKLNEARARYFASGLARNLDADLNDGDERMHGPLVSEVFGFEKPIPLDARGQRIDEYTDDGVRFAPQDVRDGRVWKHYRGDRYTTVGISTNRSAHPLTNEQLHLRTGQEPWVFLGEARESTNGPQEGETVLVGFRVEDKALLVFGLDGISRERVVYRNAYSALRVRAVEEFLNGRFRPVDGGVA